jgi:molybdate transport system permease protein
MNWQALVLTLQLAAVVCVILMAISLPLAYWLAYSRWRLRFLVESVVALPLVLPPTVLGYYLLVLFGTRTAAGAWMQRHFGHTLAFTFEGLVVASVLYSLPFAVQPIVNSFASIEPRLLDAAAVLGAGRWQRFRSIVLPLSSGGLLTGAVLAFAHTIGEFGVVLMVGGNIPGVTRTISVDLYDRVQELDFAAAHQTALVLLLGSVLLLAPIYALRSRAGLISPLRRDER